MRVVDLLQSMPGLGKVRARQTDGAARHRREPPGPRARHQAGRRARDGVRARRVTEPAQRRRTRLVVLAGPTAVGKGTRRGRHPRAPPRGLDLGLRHHPAAAAGRGATASTTGSSPTRSSTGWSPSDDLLEWAVVHGAAPLRHPARARSSWRWPPAARRCSRSTSRARARCARRCPRRSSSSWRRRRGRSWSAGWSAAAPRTRRSGSAGWPRAREELAAEPEFDVIIVNREVHAAAEELVALMTGHLGPHHLRRLVRLRVSAPTHRRRGRHQPLDRRPADQDRQQVQAGPLQRQARPADQRLLLPARRGPAGVRRPARGHPRAGEAALDRAARDQRRPADLRGRRPGRAGRRGGRRQGRRRSTPALADS